VVSQLEDLLGLRRAKAKPGAGRTDLDVPWLRRRARP
jgi:hypothetical protein